MKEFNKLIIKKETGINKELFQKHFGFQIPTAMLKAVYNTDNKRKKNDLVNVIKSGMSDLKDEIEEISENEIEIEKPNRLKDIIEKILDFNKQNQEVQGLKTLKSVQMLSRLPISLTQMQITSRK